MQETQLDKFKQELALPSSTTNIAQGVSTCIGAKLVGFYHHVCGIGKQFRSSSRGCQTRVYKPGNHPTCQFCNKYGHLLIEWCHRFDEYYESVLHKNQSQASTSNTMNATQDRAKTMENTFTQATTYFAYQDQLHIPPNLDSQ